MLPHLSKPHDWPAVPGGRVFVQAGRVVGACAGWDVGRLIGLGLFAPAGREVGRCERESRGCDVGVRRLLAPFLAVRLGFFRGGCLFAVGFSVSFSDRRLRAFAARCLASATRVVGRRRNGLAGAAFLTGSGGGLGPPCMIGYRGRD